MAEKKLGDVVGVGVGRLGEIAAAASAKVERQSTLIGALPEEIREWITDIWIDERSWLCLRVSSGARCAQLRFREPELLTELRTSGHEVSGVEVKVGRGRKR